MALDYDRFTDYLETCATRDFRYGVFDCFIFANEAVKALRGAGFADDMIGRYANNRGRLYARTYLNRIGNADSLAEFIDGRLPRTNISRRGNLVMVNQTSLGIMFGSGIVTLDNLCGTTLVDESLAVVQWEIDAD